MSDICKASFRWTREELGRGRLHHLRTRLRRRFRLLLKVASGFLLALLSTILIADFLFPSGYPLTYWVLLAFPACIWGLMFERVNAWYWGRGFAKRREANIQIDLQFSSVGMMAHSELAESTIKWKFFLRVVETSEGFLFYPHKNLFYWLPFSAFEKPDCVERVRDLVREHDIPLIESRPDN